MATCARCGGALEAEHRFCPFCGAAVAEREARKVVSALFADVVGSTALGERLDPEDFTAVVGEAVARMARAVEEFGGSVVELAGDGLLALFGAPVAHEDDAERAVRAGLRILERLGEYGAEVAARWGIDPLAVRVGIETGLAVLGPLGAGRKVEYSAMGDALNTAARLQAAAEPGSVLVGERTQRAVADLFAWGEPTDLRLKGKAEAVRAFPVAGTREDAPATSAVRAPLVGRDAELAAGDAALAAAAEGSGGVLFVAGEAGIGKSRLIAELRGRFANWTEEPAGRWLHARCVSYGEDVPYVPVRALLLDWLRRHPGAEDPAARLRAACSELLGDSAADVAPFLAALLEQEDVPELAPEGIQERTFAAVARVFRALAAGGPLVVAVDDLHWADASTLELLESLLPMTDEAALLLVLSARPEYEHGSWALRERALRELPHRARDVGLEVLAGDADRALLEALVGRDALTPELERRILERAEGNPFYLEETFRSLVDSGALVREADGWRLERDAQVEVPDTVEKLVLARIDRLEGDFHDVLSAAAVLGRQFELPVLERVVGEAGPVDVDPALRELQRVDLVRQGRRWPVPEYRFRHPLIQEAAYHALLRRHRQALHRRAATAIADLHGDRLEEQAGVLARHHQEAGDFELALEFRRRAADAALRIYANEEALEHLDGALAAAAALGRGGEAEEVRRMYWQRGVVRYDAVSDFEGCLADWETALAAARAAGDRPLEIDALISLSTGLRVTDWPAAIARMDEAVAAARESGDSRLIAGALARQAINRANLLELDGALAAGSEALEIAEATGDDNDRIVALDALKLGALMLGDLPRLDGLCAEIIDLLDRSGDEERGPMRFGRLVYRSWGLLEWSYVPAGAGRWDEALARIDEARALGRQGGFSTHLPVFLDTLARALRAQGDRDGALAAAQEAATRAGRSGNHEWRAWAEATAGWTLLDAGRHDEAQEHLDAGTVLARRAAAPMPEIRCRGLSARGHREQGSLDAARRAASETEALLGRVTVPPGGAFLYGAHAIAGAAEVWARTGDDARARALAEPALAASERAGWAEAEGELALALGDAGRARAVAERAGLRALAARAAAAG
jgi:class 3 adenylate cyclase/tetratricopeptide (TPR) repeat protein